MEGYLMFILCVFLTLVTLGVAVAVGYIAWNSVIEPIMDRVKVQKDEYWRDRYYKEQDRANYFECWLEKFGLPERVLRAVQPGTIEHLSSHDACESWEERCMITFTLDTTKLED